MSNPRLQVDIGANIKDLEKALKTVENRLSTFGKNLESIGRTLSTRMTLPLVTAGGAAIKLASDLEESLNKVDVSFRDSADEVRSFADTTLESFGIARGSALEMASLFGDMATSMGINTDEAAKMSTRLVGLAGDLRSFKNIRIDIAQTALAGIFTGETESLKRLGILIDQASLETFALSQGIQKNIQDMTQAEKVNLRYAKILQDTSNAQGDFARTSESAANQMSIFQQSVKELGEDFGTIMLPQFTEMVTRTNALVKAFGNLDDIQKKLVINTGAFLAVIGPLILILGTLATNISRVMKVAPGFLKWLFSVSGAATAAGTALAGLSAEALLTAQNVKAYRKTIADALRTMGEDYNVQEINDLIAEQSRKLEELKNNFRGTTADAVEAHQAQIRVAEEQLNALIAIRDNKALDELNTKVETATESTKELNQQLGKVFAREDIAVATPQAVVEKPDIPIGWMALYKQELEKMTPVQQRLFLANKNLEQSFQRIPNQFKNGTDAALSFMQGASSGFESLKLASDVFVEGFASGIANILVEGGKLKDMLKSIGKELLKSGLTKLFGAVLTGGLGAGTGFLGSGGGLLGTLFPKIFGAGAPVSMGMATPQLSGANVTVGGQFVLKGTDLVGSITKTQNSILR